MTAFSSMEGAYWTGTNLRTTVCLSHPIQLPLHLKLSKTYCSHTTEATNQPSPCSLKKWVFFQSPDKARVFALHFSFLCLLNSYFLLQSPSSNSTVLCKIGLYISSIQHRQRQFLMNFALTSTKVSDLCHIMRKILR